MRSFRVFLFSLFMILSILSAMTGCDGKPDSALCGQYYRHLLDVQRQGPRALLLASQTSQGKTAIVNACMEMTAYQVECALQAGSLEQMAACETAEPKSLMDRIPWPEQQNP